VDGVSNTSQRARTVRFWTALIIYAGAGWATVEALLAVREHFVLPRTMDKVVIGLFIAGFVATIILLKTRVASSTHAILQAFRAFAVVLLLAAGVVAAQIVEQGAFPGDLSPGHPLRTL
jgi:hypothetical protein